ncbi:MAG: cytidine deaminase [Planctomycetota bacterium]|jgi:cytidine deaminase
MTNADGSLLDIAAEAMKRAWSPYSGFSVGAAIETESGKVFTGCNVENASYGLTICAERVALFKAVSEGERTLKRIALVCSGDRPIFPCGACLQVLKEFSTDLPVVTANTAGQSRKTRLSELMPRPFSAGDLREKEGK